MRRLYLPVYADALQTDPAREDAECGGGVGGGGVGRAVDSNGSLPVAPSTEPERGAGGKVARVAVLRSAPYVNPPFNRAGCLEEFAEAVPWCVSNCGRVSQGLF